MRLHARDFEKALRRKVRKTIRSSPELRREFRAARKFRKPARIMLLVRPLISLGLATAAWQMWARTNHLTSGLAVITLWGLIFVFIHTQRLISCLYGSSDLRALALLPVPEPIIFRWQAQKFFRGALWSLFDMLLAYAALALRADLSVLKWFAVVPLAGVAWLELLALAALCVTNFPRAPYQLASTLLMAVVFISLMARQLVGDAVIALVDRAGQSLNFILPTGWPGLVFEGLLTGNIWTRLVFLIPSGMILWSLKSSFLRLAAGYQFEEWIAPEPADLVPSDTADASPAAPANLNRPARLGPTAIEELIQSGKFLELHDWRGRGFLEHFFWRWCSARERALAEFVFPNGPEFTRPWRRIFRNLAIACVAAIGAGFISSDIRNWVFGLGFFISLCQALARLMSTGKTFQLTPCSGVNVPLYAGYPIGFRELGNFLFKYSLAQFPWLLLFATGSCLVAFYFSNSSLALGAWSGLKVAGLLVASRFVFLTFSFSSGTNDTARIRFRSILLLLFAVIFGLGFAGLGAASLFLPGQLAAWLCWTGAALEAYAFFRLYGWFYNRNQFDLMNLPQQ